MRAANDGGGHGGARRTGTPPAASGTQRTGVVPWPCPAPPAFPAPHAVATPQYGSHKDARFACGPAFTRPRAALLAGHGQAAAGSRAGPPLPAAFPARPTHTAPSGTWRAAAGRYCRRAVVQNQKMHPNTTKPKQFRPLSRFWSEEYITTGLCDHISAPRRCLCRVRRRRVSATRV